jgi:hypothetical protein
LFAEDLEGISCPTALVGFAVGSSGTILGTTDGGTTWGYQTSGVSDGLNEVIFPDSVNGYIVGDNGIILKTTTGGIVTSIDPLDQPLPTKSGLLNAYPNPFNPETNIGFQIAEYGPVNLGIVDMLGRTVATLISERLSPGSYSRRWDASGLPSGIYFARLQTGSVVEVRKMVYLR